MRSFCTHIFSAKNISTLDFRHTRRLNESLSNDFIKLTMLWTTGPRILNLHLATSTMVGNDLMNYILFKSTSVVSGLWSDVGRADNLALMINNMHGTIKVEFSYQVRLTHYFLHFLCTILDQTPQQMLRIKSCYKNVYRCDQNIFLGQDKKKRVSRFLIIPNLNSQTLSVGWLL